MKRIYMILLASIIILSGVLIFVGKDVLIKEYIIQPPSYLSINDVDVKPVYVTDANVDTNITAYINHDGGYTQHAYMLIRAIDSNTKLLVNQTSVPIPETDVHKTLIINKNILLDRNKDYELRISLFDNDSVIDTGSINIKGLSALIPKSKDNGIVLKNIDFSVGGVSVGRVNIIPYIYLENIGSQKNGNLTLIIKFIQADSNLLADMSNVNIGEIDSEHTIIETANLTVPDQYNYNAVVELWKDSIYINEWEKPVMLAPTKTMPKGTTEKQVNIEVSNFVRQGIVPGATAAMQNVAPVPTPTPREPGFDIVIGMSAILVVLIYRRYLKKFRRP